MKSEAPPNTAQSSKMDAKIVPPASKMVSKSLPKPAPRPPRTEPSNKSCFKLESLIPGTLKIIKSVQLSSISSFSAYSKPEAEYHFPGLLLGSFSHPVGIEKVPGTCYQIVGNSSPSKYAPSAAPSGSQMHPKSIKNPLWHPLRSQRVPEGSKLLENDPQRHPK